MNLILIDLVPLNLKNPRKLQIKKLLLLAILSVQHVRYIAAMNTRVINEKPNLLYKLYQLSYSENMFDLSYKEFAKELFNSNFITSSHLESVLNDSITTELNKIDEDLVYVKRFGIRSVPTVILGNGKVLSNEELKNFFSLVDIYGQNS